MAKIWDTLWAVSGDKITIPEPAQAGGQVSVTQGWTPDYELPDTDPDYKPVGREEMNGALNEITSSIQQLQAQGAAEWSASLAPYLKGAEVIHSGERWYNPEAGNNTEPGVVGHTWQKTSEYLTAANFQGSMQVLAAKGLQKLPGGLILQWVRGELDPGTTTDPVQTLVFHQPFPNGILAVSVSLENPTLSGASDAAYHFEAPTLSQMRVIRQFMGGGESTAQTRPWAIVLGW